MHAFHCSTASPIRLLCVVLVALILRTAFPVFLWEFTKDPLVFHNNDTWEYVEPARSLLRTGEFLLNGVPETERTPGYSLFFIPGLLIQRIEATTIAVQIMLSCLAVVLVYGIALELYGDKLVPLICAALYACEPLSIIYAGYLYSETVYGVVFLGFVYFLARYFNSGRVPDIVAAGAAIGLSTYVRPISLYLPAVVVLSAGVWIMVRTRSCRVALARLVLFFAVAMVIVAPWVMRNGLATGDFRFSSISDENFYFFIGATILAKKNGIPVEKQQEMMGYTDRAKYFSLHPEQRTWSPEEIRRYRAAVGIRLMKENPATYLWMVVKMSFETLHETGIGELMSLLGISSTSPTERLEPQPNGDCRHRCHVRPWVSQVPSYYAGRSVIAPTFQVPDATKSKVRSQFPKKSSRHDKNFRDSSTGNLLTFVLKALASVILICYWGLAVLGVARGPWRQEVTVVVLLAVSAYLILIPALFTIGYSRFRHPVMPLVCLMAGGGLWVVLNHLKLRASGLVR